MKTAAGNDAIFSLLERPILELRPLSSSVRPLPVFASVPSVY
ncbi:MAG: hypothetical protein WCO60_01455 [Verrucomicrobiota bacterium]